MINDVMLKCYHFFVDDVVLELFLRMHLTMTVPPTPAGPGGRHSDADPPVPVLEKLLPPVPPPAPTQAVQEPEPGPNEEEETGPEPPQLARRRQLLRILIPDDNEAPISDDDEPGAPAICIAAVVALHCAVHICTWSSIGG